MQKTGTDSPVTSENNRLWEGDTVVAGSRQPIPKVNFQPGQRYADINRRFGIASSIAQSVGGRLWCGFTSGGEAEGPLNYGIVVFSDDKGLTWSPPAIVLDTDMDGPIRTDHVTVWTSPCGDLWIIWSQYPEGLRGPHSSLWAITCANPDAHDRQWTAPRKLADELNLLTTPTVRADGTWIFPTGCWMKSPDHPSRPLISTDHGATFHPGGPLLTEVNPDFDEYMIVERANGSLVVFNRHRKSFLQCESVDGGRTWTRQIPNGIPHTNSRFAFLKLQSGAWLLIKHGNLDWVSDLREPGHPSLKGRSHLTAFLSHDEGATWNGGLVLDERECSYPFGCQAPDGTILVSYERQRWKQPEILLARFTDAAVAAGSPTSDVQLRQLVNKAGSTPAG